MTMIENAMLRRRTLLGTAVALFGLAGGASAYVQPEPADLQVVDRDTGQPLRIWRARGRLYVAGDPGDRYALRVTNRTAGRVLVVLSVDGVNVVTGQTASYEQNGYVFDPYETYDVTGWRKSRDEVAAFAFAPLSQSYAARTGRPGDVGVIGMAVFRERYVAPEPPPAPPPPPPPMILPQSSEGLDRGAADAPSTAARGAAPMAAPPPQAAAQPSDAAKAYVGMRDERLGTAHGARERSYVDMTTFERATRYPECVRQIEYDTYAHLIASGVIHARAAQAAAVSPRPGRGGLRARSARLKRGYAPSSMRLNCRLMQPGRQDARAQPDDAAGDAADLLRAHGAGDPHAFARLYDRYDRPCFRFIQRMLGPAHADAAEDLHQETWIAVSRSAAAFDPARASFQAWLFTIARNKVWDHLRRQKVAVLASASEDEAVMVADAGPNPLQQVESRELAERMISAVKALPLEQRGAFVLFAGAGLSLAEIAEASGVGVETAKSRLRYARATLRRVLAGERPGHEVSAPEGSVPESPAPESSANV